MEFTTRKCKLTPKILKKFMNYKINLIQDTIQLILFFHGGSGSTLEEIREGMLRVIKMNIDTDLQFAFTEGIRDYMVKTLIIWLKLAQKVLISNKNTMILEMDP
jgi:fructose/tagatose bisphosphate aldolase